MTVVLADQCVPRPAAAWLALRMPSWTVYHTFDLGLSEASDVVIGAASVRLGAVISTFDEDFLDTRTRLRSSLVGVIRLRIWPNLLPNVIAALQRLIDDVDEAALVGSAIVVDQGAIRVRPL